MLYSFDVSFIAVSRIVTVSKFSETIISVYIYELRMYIFIATYASILHRVLAAILYKFEVMQSHTSTVTVPNSYEQGTYRHQKLKETFNEFNN